MRAALALVCGVAVVSRAAPIEDLEGIVLVFPDQWRFDWDGRRSDVQLSIPTIRDLYARGTSFEHAYVPAPVCAPSRSCLASGREYDEAGVPNNFHNDFPISDSEPTFYKLLRDAGWHTMTTGKDDLTKATQPGANGTFNQAALGFSDALRCSGKMDVLNGGPHEPYGLMLNATEVRLEDGKPVNAFDAHKACLESSPRGAAGLCDATSYPASLYEDDWTAANAQTLLQRRPRGKPFFLEVSFPGPHPPFTVTGPMRDVVGGRKYPPPVDNPSGSGDDCPANASEPYTGRQCAYAAEIENLDRLTRNVLDAVASSTVSQGERVVVCFSSDHGTMLFDHGDQGKTMPWQPSASVPLVCTGPGIAPNATVSLPVATLDLAGTFLDIAGVAPHPNMTTRSLMPLLSGGDAAAAQYRGFVSSGLQSAPFGDAAADEELLAAGRRAAAGAMPSTDDVADDESLRAGGDGPAEGRGSYSWRMVVQRMADGRSLKFICCKGRCNGAPSTVPAPGHDGYTRLLYDTVADPDDMRPLDDADAKELLRRRLPPGFCPPAAETAPKAAPRLELPPATA